VATDLVQRKMNGALYRQARQARKLEQGELARRINVSQSKVSMVEHGDSEYSTAEKEPFADVIGVPLVALLDWLGYNVGPQPLAWMDWYAQALAGSAESTPPASTPTPVSRQKTWRVREQGYPATAPQGADDESSAVRYRGHGLRLRLPEALAHSARTLAPA
jgi:transcriptional regulator with XRE-family HTH domain